ncbi:Acetamidase [Cercospora zeina]
MTGGIDYLAIAKQKREQRASRIPEEWKLSEGTQFPNNVLNVPTTCGLLTTRELEITGEHDGLGIVQKIRDRTYTAEEVTRAFCKRAAIAQQLTNCLTEIFFDDAIERAKELDREQKANPETPLRPLHGLPISLKDSFRIPGRDSSVGLVCFANSPDSTYSPLPQLLLDLGAVLYCKTNVPQTMMTADSDNNVFGRTVNPVNAKLTAGGSTGGEGALIAMRGSVLGIGTDVAGSIRIPSVCNGIYGLRTSAGMVAYAGQRSPAPPGMAGLAAVAGPMATSLRSCEYLMKVMTEAEPWKYDHGCLHIPWRNSERVKPSRIGVVLDDGAFTPWPPVRRTMNESVAKLERAGIEIVYLSLPDVREAIEVTHRYFALDGCKFIQARLKEGGEPEVESVKGVNLAAIPAASLEDLFELNFARGRIQQAYHSLWLANRLDGLLIPGASTTATPHDTWGPITYTALWNFLDYPTVILPTGRVTSTDAADDVSNAKYGEADQRNYKLYTGPEDFEGAALAVQLVGMKQEDQRLLQIAETIDEILGH